MLVVETIARIRREFFVKGKSIKESVRDVQVSRNTVRKVIPSEATAFTYGGRVTTTPPAGLTLRLLGSLSRPWAGLEWAMTSEIVVYRRRQRAPATDGRKGAVDYAAQRTDDLRELGAYTGAATWGRIRGRRQIERQAKVALKELNAYPKGHHDLLRAALLRSRPDGGDRERRRHAMNRIYSIFLIGLILAGCGSGKLSVTMPSDVKSPPELANPGAEIPLRVGIYVHPGVRAQRRHGGTHWYEVGEIVANQAIEQVGRAFRSVKPVNRLPAKGSSLPGIDAVLAVEDAQLHWVNDDLHLRGFTEMTLTMAAYDAQGARLHQATKKNRADITYGLSIAQNRPYWVETLKVTARAGVIQFLRDFRALDLAKLLGAPAPPPAALSSPPATPPPAVTAAPPVAKLERAGFPSSTLALAFRKGPPHPDDVAVIIGNADYGKQGTDIPDVTPAYADAEGFKRYATEALGVREGNIIDLRDATGAQLVQVFGSERRHKGKLFDWVRPGISRVFVYYSGHGAPGGGRGR